MTEALAAAAPDAGQLNLIDGDSTMDDSIPELKIERMADGLILLEQSDCGNDDRVAIHSIHLRHMAEKFGLVPSSDLQAQKTIATLERRLRMLDERVRPLGGLPC